MDPHLRSFLGSSTTGHQQDHAGTAAQVPTTQYVAFMQHQNESTSQPRYPGLDARTRLGTGGYLSANYAHRTEPISLLQPGQFHRLPFGLLTPRPSRGPCPLSSPKKKPPLIVWPRCDADLSSPQCGCCDWSNKTGLRPQATAVEVPQRATAPS